MVKPRADSSATLMMTSSTNVILEGYMLKKKRKRMQGMAKRWFRLSNTGALSYSFHPNSPIRDSILVSLAFVYASRKQRVFHIDSGRVVMHCRCLTEVDFDRWTEALKGFIGTVNEGNIPGSPETNNYGTTGREREEEDEGEGEDDLKRVVDTVEKMSLSVKELEEIYQEMKLTEGGAPFQHMSSSSSYNASSSPSQKFKFLKKGSSKESPRIEDYFESKPTPDALVRQLGQSLILLKAQYELLSALVPSLSLTHSPTRSSSALGHLKPLINSRSVYSNTNLTGVNPSRASSFSFAASEETDEYYEDARSGLLPGEFFLEEENEALNEEDEDQRGRDSSDEADDDDDDYYVEEEEEEQYEGRDRAGSNETKRMERVMESEETSEKLEDESVNDATQTMVVERRRHLPVPASGDEFSMLGMLRKNVGKDLSTISFPVTFNEPLSALQRIAEELEYSDLLHRAANVKDSIERLVLVATFAITGSAGNKFRSSRKPFNPLLGETYECIRPDKGLKFISEKVSHHPPIMAFHAESTTPSSTSKSPAWSIDGHIAPSQKFWGMSFELMFPGEFRLRFDDTGDVFDVQKPSSFVKNLVAGTKYLEIIGELVVTNLRTSEKALIEFKEGSSWGGNSGRNKIEGKILDSDGRLKAELVGRWDECVDRKKGGKEFQRLWEVNEFPKNPSRYYGFSPFSMTLNEVTPIESNHLPSSDSRLRPDQIALELGQIDLAEQEKKRVEEKQREKRKETVGTHQPQYFEMIGQGEQAGSKEWKYRGDYFQKRAAGTLRDVDIF